MRPPRRFWPCVTALGVLALVGSLYFWWVGQNMPHWVLKQPGASSYNALYAKSVLAGHVYMHPAPPQMAKLEDPYDPAQYGPYYSFDLSYYRGYIYSYFSIFPPLLLYLPWNAITGTYLSEQFGAAFFMVLGFAVSFSLLASLRRRYLPNAPSWALGIAVLVVAAGNLSLLLFWPPYYCQVVQACARFLQISALGAVYLALQPGRRAGRWLAVASLLCGLMVITRPIFLPAIVLLLPAWWVISRQRRDQTPSPSRARWKFFAAAIFPLAMVGVGQMALNYARFDSVLEFGTTYQQFGADLREIVQFSPAYVPAHVYEHLFHLPTFLRYFPFVTYQAEPMGALVMLPFSWLVLLLWTGCRAQPIADRPAFGAVALGSVLAAAGNLLMLSCYYLVLVRHQVDFVLPLSFAAALGLLAGAHAWHGRRGRTRLLGATAGLFAAVNVLVTVCFATTIPDQGPLPRLARVLNTPVYWWERLRGEVFTNTLRLHVVLPEPRPGVVEPLVYTGVQSGDFVYLRCLDATNAVIGYSHTELGAIESEPFAIGADRRHTFEITMGSLAPAAAHPAFAGWKPSAIDRARRHIQVKADGKIFLDQHTQFHPATPGDVWIGEAPAHTALGKFTGKIVKIDRVPLSPSPPPISAWPGDGAAFDVQFLNRRTGRSDPILSTGTRGKGDLLFVTYLDDTRVQFGIDHWQAGRALGETVAVANTPQVHAIEVRNMPATAGGKTAVFFDGRRVLEVSSPLYPTDSDSVYFGLKTFLSATEPIFGGRIGEVRPITPPP